MYFCSMLLEIHPDNPDPRKIAQVVNILRNGGIIIYPTDTIYGLGCDITNEAAIEKICRLKGIKPNKANFSFICNDLSHISDYTMAFSTAIYKIMKKALPGPYTFILRANNQVPRLFKTNKKTVGIRVPNNNIARRLVQELGNPILSTSLKLADDIVEYPTDPYQIFYDYENLVDVVIDGGAGSHTPSTIVDVTADEPVLIREGAGEVFW